MNANSNQSVTKGSLKYFPLDEYSIQFSLVGSIQYFTFRWKNEKKNRLYDVSTENIRNFSIFIATVGSRLSVPRLFVTPIIGHSSFPNDFHSNFLDISQF